MKAERKFLVLGYLAVSLGFFSLALESCTSTGAIDPAQVAQGIAISQATVQALCPVVAPLATQAIGHNSGSVKVSAQYAAGMCDLATGQPVTSAKLDANSGAWLGAIAQTLAAANAVAPVAAQALNAAQTAGKLPTAPTEPAPAPAPAK